MSNKKLLAVCMVTLFICLASCGGGGGGYASNPPTAAGFRKLPYLIYSGHNTQMTALWQTTVAGTSKISWGIDTSYGSGSVSVSEINADHLFRHIFTGLTPGRKYYYQIELSDRIVTGSFVAAPTGNGQTTAFLIGDTRTYPAEMDHLAARMVSIYSANPAFQGIMLHAGDLATDGAQPHYWDDELFNPLYPNLRRLLSEIPLQAVIGNHEGNGILYSTFFPYPFQNGRYWSFDYGVVHVTFVDQYLIPGGAISPEQLAWIASDLAATNKPWKIIMFHEPGWSAGPSPNNVNVQLQIQPLAKQYGAIVVAGHNHNYARAVVDGVVHITTGGGGAELHAITLPSPGVVIAESTHHFCTLEASTNTLTFKAIRADGSYIDTFTLTR